MYKGSNARRFFSMLLACLLITAALPVMAADVTNSSPAAISIDSSSFKVTSSGTIVTDYSAIPQNADVAIRVNFSVIDHGEGQEQYDAKGGDSFTFPLPAALLAVAGFTEVSNQPITITTSSGSSLIAYYSVSSAGVATVMFTDAINTLSEVKGYIDMQGTFRAETISAGQTISFSLAGSAYTLTFGAEPQTPPTPQASISKSGVYDKTTHTVTWTVNVAPPEGQALQNVRVVETPDGRQSYIASSSSIGEPVASGSSLLFYLNTVSSPTSFTFQTSVSESIYGAEDTSKNLQNEAVLQNLGVPLATATSVIPVGTDWINKSGISGTDASGQYIDWTIRFNNDYRALSASSVVTDTLPRYLKVDENSLMAGTPGSLAPALFSSASDYTDSAGQQLTYMLPVTVTQTQQLTFRTYVQDAYYQQQDMTTFTNVAKLAEGPNTYTAQNSVGILPGTVTSLIAKTGEGYNKATREITWKLVVNKNGRAVENAVITDAIRAGQTFVEGSVQVTGISGTPSVSYDAGVLTVGLGDLTPANNNVIVSFKTLVTNPDHYAKNNGGITYQNGAQLSGVGIATSSSTGSQTVLSKVIEKTNTGYDYSTRVLSWQIIVNQNNMPMSAASITDTIPAGQEYVAGSLRVDGSVPAEGVLTQNGSALTIALGDITAQKVVTLQSRVTDDSVFMKTTGNVSFSNKASLDTGYGVSQEVTASKTVDNTGLSKQVAVPYSASTGTIGWKVPINSNHADLQNVTITDTLQDGLELDTESVHLYGWNQSSTGVMTQGGEVPAANYSFTYNYVTRLFSLTLPNGAQGYILTFNTDITKNGSYTNSITLSGAASITAKMTNSISVSDHDSSAGGSGTNGAITVVKVNEKGERIPAPAVFELLDSMHNVKSTGTTDSTGAITFSNLKLRVYYVREKSSPLGYTLNAAEQKVTLSGGSDATRLQTVHIADEPLTASAIFLKTDKTDHPLSGGKFSLYAAADTTFASAMQTVAADAQGRIVFPGLRAGTYVVREAQAPAGYMGTSETRTATLTVDPATNTLADVTVSEALVNTYIPVVYATPTPTPSPRPSYTPMPGGGSIVITDHDNPPGTEIGVYDKDGNLVTTVTTDNNGKATIKDLPYGDYTVRPVNSPTQPIPLSLDKAHPRQKVTLGPGMPKTGDTQQLVVAVFVVATLLTGTVLLLVRRRPLGHRG